MPPQKPARVFLPSSLSPRRQEICAIISDHPFISLDGIARRFPTFTPRTIAYDVAWLVRNQRVEKFGVTRGACYAMKGIQGPT